MNLNKKLVCTAITTAMLSFGMEQVTSQEVTDAKAQTTDTKVEQKPAAQAVAVTATPAVSAVTATPAVSTVTAAPAVSKEIKNQPPAPPTDEADFETKILATVDGQPITGGMLGAYLAGRTSKMRGMKAPPQMQNMALNNLISINLLAKAAREAGIDTRPGVVMSLNLQRDQLLAQMLLQERASTHAPSEEVLKKAYDEKYAMPGQEFKACHVLVKTEDEAKQVIEQLGKGTDFATVAKEKSIDPSANKGGDLGWFEASQMVKPFADAVAAMEIGTTSAKPVQSQFGWHVIKLEDKRAAKQPEFNSVRARLQSELQRAALTEYVEQLRSKAKIEMQEPLEQPQPTAAPVETTKK